MWLALCADEVHVCQVVGQVAHSNKHGAKATRQRPSWTVRTRPLLAVWKQWRCFDSRSCPIHGRFITILLVGYLPHLHQRGNHRNRQSEPRWELGNQCHQGQYTDDTGHHDNGPSNTKKRALITRMSRHAGCHVEVGPFFVEKELNLDSSDKFTADWHNKHARDQKAWEMRPEKDPTSPVP